MGGINCPPPSNIKTKDSKEFYDSYTKNLANYSRALFQGIANFYSSNVQIENAVLGNNSDINKAFQSMLKCEKNFYTSPIVSRECLIDMESNFIRAN